MSVGTLGIDIIDPHKPAAASLFDVAETGEGSHKAAEMERARW